MKKEPISHHPQTQAINIPVVISRYIGVYSPENELLHIHKTKKGAMKHRNEYEAQHGEGFYIDNVVVLP